MSDDQLPAEDGGAVEPTPAPVDFEKRWKDTHAKYNELNERLARFEKDPNALIEFIQEKHPDLLAEDEEEDIPELEPDDDEPVAPPPDPRIDWLAQREAERQYQTDLKKFVGDRDLPEEGNEWIEARSRLIADKANKPWGPDHLKQAVDEFYEFVEKVKGPQRREAPTPPQPGSAGEQKRDPRSRDQRRARMAAALAAGEQQ